MLGLDAIERSFIYFPAGPVSATPAEVGLAFEDVSFTAADGVALHGWFIPGPERTTMIWFHGNAGNIGHRLRGLQALHRALSCNLFIFDYRGFGRSSGTPSEAGLYADAEAALDVLRARSDVDAEALVYFGE